MKRSRQKTLYTFLSSARHDTERPENRSNPISRFIKCPLCEKSLPMHKIESHASDCNGIKGVDDDTSLEHSKSQSVASTKCEMNPSTLRDCNTSKQNGAIKTSKSLTDESIPGLFIYENFVTEEEEREIICYLDSPNDIPWKEATFNGKHKGKRWGVHCSLRDRKVYQAENPLPICIKHIIDRSRELSNMKGCIPNEANAIDYRRQNGDYLKSHVDDRQLSKEPIANLSLAGDCIMTFRLEKEKMKGILPDTVKVMLPRRTLQVLTQKARYDYSHGIDNGDLLNDRRISITMRESPLTPR